MLHKYSPACVFIRLDAVYLHQKLRHLVSRCLDSICFAVLLGSTDLCCSFINSNVHRSIYHHMHKDMKHVQGKYDQKCVVAIMLYNFMCVNDFLGITENT